ncbi:hypothetical protein YC2023_079300 [Brassica napus]
MISKTTGCSRLNINGDETYKASGKTDEARTISDLSGLYQTSRKRFVLTLQSIRATKHRQTMNSRQVLRVVHGAWNLHQNGEWRFERKTNDLGFPAINGSEVPQRRHEVAPAGSDVIRATGPSRSHFRCPELESRSRNDVSQRPLEVARVFCDWERRDQSDWSKSLAFSVSGARESLSERRLAATT